MTKLIVCRYGGGHLCKRQGGAGSVVHSSGYVHPRPTLEEVGKAIGDPVEPLTKGPAEIVPAGLDGFFNEDSASAALGVAFSEAVNVTALIKGSLYDFDLTSEEGVTRLMELLPIIDRDILKEITQEIWPGYPVNDETFDDKFARNEIRGYLLDYLDGHGQDV